MLKFSGRFRTYFAPDIRYRGDVYFRIGTVRDLARNGDVWTCVVVGGRRYRPELVEVEEGKEYSLYCDCPFHERGEFCKHGWAMLAAIDQLLPPEAAPNSPRLRHAQKRRLAAATRGEPSSPKRQKAKPAKATSSAWRKQLADLGHETSPAFSPAVVRPRLAYYALDPSFTPDSHSLRINFCHAEKLKAGGYGVIRRGSVGRPHLPHYEDPGDRSLLERMLDYGLQDSSASFYQNPGQLQPTYSSCRLPPAAAEELLASIIRTGRLVVPRGYDANSFQVVQAAEGSAWSAELDLEREAAGFRPVAKLRRGSETIVMSKPFLLTPRNLLVDHTIYPLSEPLSAAWLKRLPSSFVRVPPEEIHERIGAFGQSFGAAGGGLPIHDLTAFGWREEKSSPAPLVRCSANSGARGEAIAFELFFRYGSAVKSGAGRKIFNVQERTFITPDGEAEAALTAEIGSPIGSLSSQEFVPWSEMLLRKGWEVEVDKRPLRLANDFKIELSGGTDWLDLRGKAHFARGGESSIPELLKALKQRAPFVRLGDGSLGILPKEWLERLGLLADWAGGESAEEALRVPKSRAPLIAALLAEETSAAGDETFQAILAAARAGSRPRPRKAAPGFGTELRAYQQEGLGWLDHLAAVGYGGILADDMGLGKTVQVLARLHEAYRSGATDPSIIVVPKSLLFNWQAEARRFTPGLKVWVHAGANRKAAPAEITGHHLILVTYAALRLDIEFFSRQTFLYVIADEAQAIKNPSAQAHQSCLLLKGPHRLAMTGTPVENSGTDLLALLDFVNPGLLGGSARQKLGGARSDGPAIASLAKVLRPFILRRTKAAVLKDLPEKSERIDFCELSPIERKRYNELAAYFRTKVKRSIDEGNFGRSKILVLEALLRLRQAACHPGLLDDEMSRSESTKLNLLLERLEVLAAEGHQALVFSQFTKLLDLAGEALERRGIAYERLDGQVALDKRQAAVERFQAGGGARVFLISLKAGGVGLNLTAANYVFLLDPWWNPAAESQAIDRSHRIGQKHPVMAYRIIAKDTVEEKILSLQAEKRSLAEALLDGKTTGMKGLSVEEVLALLS